MIHYLKGDLFESSAEALVNTVNTVGVMGKGIALQFKEAFPNNYSKYRKTCKEKKFKIGTLLTTEDKNIFGNDKIIINFPTKTHWKLPSEYSYIEAGLKALKNEILKRGIKSIAIPPLGSNNGGLDWNKVKPMIELELKDLDCEIFLYEPSKDIIQKMKEERVRLTPARAMLILLMADMIRYGEFLSPFAAEKLVYFMQKFGAKDFFNIDFNPYYYGPYSSGKITHVLYRLNGSYIKGMVGMDNKPFDFIWLTDDAEEAAQQFLECYNDRKIWDICNKTKFFLQGFYSNFGLELLSTTDYILNHNKYLNNWKEIDDKTVLNIVIEEIGKMSSRKKNLLKPQFVSMALCHLKNNFKN